MRTPSAKEIAAAREFDLILKKELKKIIDWNLINKSDYLSAMERRPINDLEIRYLISNTLTEKIIKKSKP